MKKNPIMAETLNSMKTNKIMNVGDLQGWEKFEADVLRIARKGILTNVPKPKPVWWPPPPPPELKRLLHLEVDNVEQLIELFDEDEREFFN